MGPKIKNFRLGVFQIILSTDKMYINRISLNYFNSFSFGARVSTKMFSHFNFYRKLVIACILVFVVCTAMDDEQQKECKF